MTKEQIDKNLMLASDLTPAIRMSPFIDKILIGNAEINFVFLFVFLFNLVVNSKLRF